MVIADTLKIRGLQVRFNTLDGSVHAVDGVDLEIRRGETLGLVGESGCGKTVTARSITCLNPSPPAVVEGEILLMTNDKCGLCGGKGCQGCFDTGREYIDLLKQHEEMLEKIRGSQISMVFQNPMNSLNPVYTVGWQLSESFLLCQRDEIFEDAFRMLEVEAGSPLKREYLKMEKALLEGMKRRAWFYWLARKIPLLNRFQKYVQRAAKKKSLEMLKQVKIPNCEKVFNQYPHELSGGMQQRILIAMALAGSPRLLIADEPTTALDVTTQAQIIRLMKKLQEDSEASLLFITHDLGVICLVADRVAIMYGGVIQEVADVRSIFKVPLHPYTKLLLKATPRTSETKEFLPSIPGTVPNLIDPPHGCRFHPRCPMVTEACSQTKPDLVEIGSNHWVRCHRVSS